jgi:hypothetical protein
MRAGVLLGASLLVLIAACPRPVDGEQWARARYGEEGATRLRQEAKELYEKGKDSHFAGMPYAPRPLVVLEALPASATKDDLLRFHPVNAELPAKYHAVSVLDIASLVIVLPEDAARNNNPDIALPGRKILIGDRTKQGFTTVKLAFSDERELASALQAIPSAPPQLPPRQRLTPEEIKAIAASQKEASSAPSSAPAEAPAAEAPAAEAPHE